MLLAFQFAELHAKSARSVPATAVKSATAAYDRTGSFSSANPAPAEDATAGKGRKPYSLFAADAMADAAKDTCCTKRQCLSGRLGPGLMACPRRFRSVPSTGIRLTSALVCDCFSSLQAKPFESSHSHVYYCTAVCSLLCGIY